MCRSFTPFIRTRTSRAHTAELLSGKPNILLCSPLSYPEFIDLMRRSYLLLSDSGGVQEEAPSLGKPVLVLRETTERPEAVEAGTARLVGADEQAIVNGVNELLNNPEAYDRMSRLHNPYGDGYASRRIVRARRRIFGRVSSRLLGELTWYHL